MWKVNKSTYAKIAGDAASGSLAISSTVSVKLSR